MSTINALNELATIEKINPANAIQQDELDALAWDLRDNPAALALVLFLWDTGARATEAATLRVGWVMPADNSAVLKYHGCVRPVKYGDYAARALTDWLKIRPKVKHSRVFFDPMTLEVFNRQRIVKYFSRLLLSLNTERGEMEYCRPGINIHSFRSSFALRILASTPPRAMRFMLGLPGAGNAGVVHGESIRDGFYMTAAHPRKFLTASEIIQLMNASK